MKENRNRDNLPLLRLDQKSKSKLTQKKETKKPIQLYSSNFKNDNIETLSNKSLVHNSSLVLHQAAIEGSIDEVKLHVKELRYNNKEIDDASFQGCTPLHLASRFNRLNVVAFLIENGSNINEYTKEEKNTPLLLAAKYSNTEVARYLCQQDADVKLTNIHGSTALHLAACKGNVEICKILVQQNSDVNAPDIKNCTPLHMAIHGGNNKITKLLIENGANVYAIDAEGEAPIHYAAAMNQEDLIVLLTKGALAIVDKKIWEETQRSYVNLKNLKQDTALHIAAQENHLVTVKTLVSIGANVNDYSATHSTPLHLAAINGETKMVEYLLEHNAKINVFDHQNMTPTHKACQSGYLDVIRLLIERGAQIDSKDCNSFTPLMWAVSKGHNDAVEYLLKSGASVAINEMNMKNVLHIAIENGHCSTLKVLLKNGGSSLIDSHDMDFRRPLHYAVMNGVESVKILIQENPDTDLTDNEEKTALHLAAEYGKYDCLLTLVKNSTRNINSTDEKGSSPLHLAAKNGSIDKVRTLIEMGAQISCGDHLNRTPLDYAAINGHFNIVLILLNNGADVNRSSLKVETPLHHAFINRHASSLKDKTSLRHTSINLYASSLKDETPLHHASINGHIHCINILLDHGANISYRNENGKNCMDLAIENHCMEACRLFVMHKRWKDALTNIDNEGYTPIEKLISLAPDIAKIVLDKCIEYSKHDETSEAYSIKYDFQFLNFQKSQPGNSSKKPYFGPSCMIEFNRESLLSHPVTVQFINDKWSRLGRWVHLISLFIYILFVCMLTGLLVADKKRENKKDKRTFSSIMHILIFILSAFEICKEMVQIYLLKKEYFKDLKSYLELLLYSSTFIFLFALVNQSSFKWTAGAISVLFAWTNLLLYLKRDTIFGVYVLMIIEVLKSLMNVIMVFVMIIIAFSLSFFVLFESSSFLTPEWSIVKTIIMTLGETDFNDLFINKTIINATNNSTLKDELPYPEMSYMLFTLFLIVCPIVLMNLLVGLAVGNIADVRSSAYILMLKAKVDILKALETKYPEQLLKIFYCEQLFIYPNKNSWKKSLLQFLGIINYDSLKKKQERRFKWKNRIARDLELEHIEFDCQEKRIEKVRKKLAKHLEITEKIISTMHIDCTIDNDI